MDEQMIQDDENSEDTVVPELVVDEEHIEEAAPEPVDLPTATVVELPEDPAEAVPILLTALGQAKAEANGYLETVQRVAAEFDNFRKRSIRERDDIVDRASQRLIERLLPTLDSFDAALAFQPQSEGEEKLLSGMRDTHRLMMEALAVDGFEPIAAAGVAFDPAVHEAVAGPTGDGEGELMVTEMRRGYTLRGRVVRAALVAVGHA
ncbi:MAG: nucleotide exchange factor GrpE [bacterium]|nr:nucleotide exchange factor GrpE [bacterium]MCP4965831.1 nucleotide exchange factor GrpE [bacterium]